MADTIVEPRRNVRFFCHRCHVEFQGVLQEYICPFCEGGFIEQLEGEAEGIPLSGGDDYSDADMSNIEDMSNIDEMSNMDDSDDVHRSTPPMLNDLAFLMTGGRIRGTGTGTGSTNSSASGTGNTGNGTNPRRPTVMDELIWMVSGGRPPAGAMTAGAPFVLVGTPGDYVFGGEGLDAVVTQLLGQLEHSGPPPLPRDHLAAIPTEQVTEEQAAANTACSVCWENFQLGETTSRLECEHVFHQSCITPWLQLHATCPICRRSLLPQPDPNAPPASENPTNPAPNPNTTANAMPNTNTITEAQIRLAPRVVIRRATGPLSVIRRFPSQTHTWDSLNTSTSGSSPASSVTTGGIWAPQTRSTNSTASNNSTSSLNSNDRDMQYNTDIDYD